MSRLQVFCYVAILALVLAVFTSPSHAIIPASKEADFLDWLMENYKSDQGFVDEMGKRQSPWALKQRTRCNPLYDWNCNNPGGRVGRRR